MSVEETVETADELAAKERKAQCAYCGTETDHPEFFFNEQRSFRTGIWKVCPTCWQRRQSIQSRRWLVFHGVMLLFGVVLVLFRPDVKLGRWLLNLEILYAAAYVSIVPHELGHLAAGKLLGMRVFRMIFGSGRVLLSWKTFGVPTELRSWPTSGCVLSGFLTKKWLRLRNAICSAAGPLMNVLIAVALAKLGDFEKTGFRGNYGMELHPLRMLFFANVYLAVMSLFPQKETTEWGEVASDGLQILKAPFMKGPQIDEVLAATPAIEALTLIGEKRLNEAEPIVEAGLRQFPKSISLLSIQGVIALEKLELERGRECSLMLLNELPEGHAQRPVAFNNIAYANAMLGRPEFAKEADEYSAATLKAMSWFPAFQGTRGAVLVQFGKLEEGRQLLESAVATMEDANGKATNLGWLAIAAVRQGHLEEAEQFLEQARALGGETAFLRWARASVEARESQSPWAG